MRFALLLVLLLVGSVALGAPPRLPEEALRGRNAQYQQGFRDGFREALRMSEGGGTGGQGNRTLRIESATYGSERRTCDFTRRLNDQASGRPEVVVRANNLLCGDPDRGADKSAKVHYSCGRDRRTVRVPEGRSATLRCN